MKVTDSLEAGDIVQIDPEHDDVFGGCLMIITKVKSWGAQGGIAVPGQEGTAYYRCKFEHMEWCGKTVWRLG